LNHKIDIRFFSSLNKRTFYHCI